MSKTLKALLKFWLVEQLELEEGKFNPDVLNDMANSDEMIIALAGKLPLLGQGSSRAAFLLDSKRVLKIAINEKGYAQNTAELELANNPGVAPLVTKIFRVGKDNSWLVSELVRPLTSEKEFQQLTSVPWSFLVSFMQFYADSGDIGEAFESTVADVITRDKKNRSPSPGISVRGIEHVPFVGRLFTALANRPDMMPGDMTIVSHWGKTPDQRVVLMDSGFTRDVYDAHYSTNDD
jgi:hypothetical protein